MNEHGGRGVNSKERNSLHKDFLRGYNRRKINEEVLKSTLHRYMSHSLEIQKPRFTKAALYLCALYSGLPANDPQFPGIHILVVSFPGVSGGSGESLLINKIQKKRWDVRFEIES